VPPPPQALAKNRFASARVWSNFPPAGTSIVFPPLISILTLPELTNLERAAKMTMTKASTIAVNIPTPYTIVISITV
jgi:hypothetical protein